VLVYLPAFAEHSNQTDVSCKTADTGLVRRVMCPFFYFTVLANILFIT